jgi:general stress protein YciG
MAGTRKGGEKAAKTNKQRYGMEFYINIGRLGGAKSTGGGFAADHELARRAGRLGGLRSRRNKEAERMVDRPIS